MSRRRFHGIPGYAHTPPNVPMRRKALRFATLRVLIFTRAHKRIHAIVACGIESMFIRWSVRVLAGAGIITTVLFLVPWNIHRSIGHLVFVVAWLLSPYMVLAYLNESRPSTFKRPHTEMLLMVGIIFLGIGAMIDINLIHPDPLGLIAMLLIAPVQLICLVFARVFCK